MVDHNSYGDIMRWKAHILYHNLYLGVFVGWYWGVHENFPSYWPWRVGMYWLFYCLSQTLDIVSVIPQKLTSGYCITSLPCHLASGCGWSIDEANRRFKYSQTEAFFDLASCFCCHSRSCWITVLTKELPHGSISYQDQLTLFLSALVAITPSHSC